MVSTMSVPRTRDAGSHRLGPAEEEKGWLCDWVSQASTEPWHSISWLGWIWARPSPVKGWSHWSWQFLGVLRALTGLSHPNVGLHPHLLPRGSLSLAFLLV